MPRYDYACHACDHRFEAVHPIASEPLAECPECSGALRRVIGAVGVSFKGSGFYRTDSRAVERSRRSKEKTSSRTVESPSPTAPTAAATPSATPAPSTPATAPARTSSSDS